MHTITSVNNWLNKSSLLANNKTRVLGMVGIKIRHAVFVCQTAAKQNKGKGKDRHALGNPGLNHYAKIGRYDLLLNATFPSLPVEQKSSDLTSHQSPW